MPIAPNSIDDLVCTTFDDDFIDGNGPYSQLSSSIRPRREWRWQGALHSIDDHPAIIFTDNGEQQWYTHGTRHRPEHLGPAWIKPSPLLQLYYAAGELHRRGGPAMIYLNCEKWYQCNVLHRGDGPAVIRTIKWGVILNDPPTIEWWFNGTRFKNVTDWGKSNPIDPSVFTLLKLQYG
jgi:hypothetical protein